MEPEGAWCAAGGEPGGVDADAGDAAGGEAEESPDITRPSNASYSAVRSLAKRSSRSRKRRSSARLASCASLGRRYSCCVSVDCGGELSRRGSLPLCGWPAPRGSWPLRGWLSPRDSPPLRDSLRRAGSLDACDRAESRGLMNLTGCPAPAGSTGDADATGVGGATAGAGTTGVGDGTGGADATGVGGSIASSTSLPLVCVGDPPVSASSAGPTPVSARRLPIEDSSCSSSRSLRSNSASVPVTSPACWGAPGEAPPGALGPLANVSVIDIQGTG
jgi:hypothetical protein